MTLHGYFVEVPVVVLIESSDPDMAWNEAVSQVNMALNATGLPNRVIGTGYRPRNVHLALAERSSSPHREREEVPPMPAVGLAGIHERRTVPRMMSREGWFEDLKQELVAMAEEFKVFHMGWTNFSLRIDGILEKAWQVRRDELDSR